MDAFISFISHYAFYYPLTMAWVWMIGALYFRMRWEKRPPRAGTDRRLRDHECPPPLSSTPFVSLMVPCHNEGSNAEETISSLLRQNWPNFEVIAINDCSTDETGAVLDRLSREDPRLRVVHLKQNHGKAMALRVGALVARSEYFVCIDGDALLDPFATHWIMWHFLQSPKVGTVTGNPRVRNRTTLLAKIQVGEFGSLIGLIKRAQRVYGRIFSVSGVVAGFRRSALHDIGYWHTDMATEDVDITWRLQLQGWESRFESYALSWILVPETLRGIWRQRLRWAQGGAEVFFRHAGKLIQKRASMMWPVCIEYVMGVLWVAIVFAFILLSVLDWLIPMPYSMTVFFPQWHGVVLGITCLCQFLVGIVLDWRFEPRMTRKYFWLIWYPLFYWIVNVGTVAFGVPKALFRKKGRSATWSSSDRGIQAAAATSGDDAP